jgi:hypothetical protein
VSRLPLFLAATLLATPAAAAGAIAYSPQTGGYGVAWRGADAAAAGTEAQGSCATFGGGCVVATAFEEGCGALARGAAEGVWGAASAATPAEAEARAQAACAERGEGCRIEASLCADR